MKTLAIANQKGGVAKTTSVINIGHALALKGKRVLLLDLDPQASLTVSLGYDPNQFENTIYNALMREIDISKVIYDRPNFDFIPANINMIDVESEIMKTGREFRLAESLKSVSKQYDYCLIDCPPGLGLLTINAFVAANYVLIPIAAEFLATNGTKLLLNTFDDVKQYYNKRLKIGGVFITLYDSRTVLARDMAEAIRGKFKAATFKTEIRKNIALAEAPAMGQTIFEYSPRCNGANDYQALTKEILKVL